MNWILGTLTFSVIGLSAWLLVMLVWLGRKGEMHLKTGSPYPEGKDMRPFLYLGLYVNPDDPRGWLPKSRPGHGWTVNFRTKLNAQIFMGTIAAILILTLALVLVVAN